MEHHQTSGVETLRRALFAEADGNAARPRAELGNALDDIVAEAEARGVYDPEAEQFVEMLIDEFGE